MERATKLGIDAPTSLGRPRYTWDRRYRLPAAVGPFDGCRNLNRRLLNAGPAGIVTACWTTIGPPGIPRPLTSTMVRGGPAVLLGAGGAAPPHAHISAHVMPSTVVQAGEFIE